MNTMMPKRALISVSNKAHLDNLAPFLQKNNVEVISTGGTAEYLKKLGLTVTSIQSVTGNPEAFGGRMKSISFQVSSALLFRRNHEQDLKEAKELSINPIDLVICNLYPFKEVAAKANASTEELIENIDIGGPGMIRAAAKNMEWVTVVTDPEDYIKLADALENGGTTLNLRREFALKAFSLTAQYDLAIALKLSQEFESEFPEVFSHETKSLRYGENPHQKAKLFITNNQQGPQSLAEAPVLQGKEISYNNYLDSDQAFKCVSELSHAFPGFEHCVIVKHGIPCGVASSPDQLKSLERAWECDPTSAFGGIIAFSGKVNAQSAEWLAKNFIEVVIAPDFSPEALEAFAKKKNVRLVKVTLKSENSKEWTVRSINGGILWQEEDEKMTLEASYPTKRQFGKEKSDVMKFGLVVTKYLKSNCLMLADFRDGAFSILASGVGQPNRLECLSLLMGPRLKQKNLNPEGAVLVSDAFFPFRDSIEAAKEWGIQYIVQPGGSIKDQEVIAACDELNIAMALTGERHFRH
ncbi:MAG: bifunctional phosphoribosylaminoimidazolecarboxamide formyltransferase/IMP cyclohydrolase [Bacteriovoracia bacterium]